MIVDNINIVFATLAKFPVNLHFKDLALCKIMDF